MRATAKLVNNSNAATSTQIANWMGGAEEFGFVGHSDYLVAIIPISTLNFDALCPNLTKAVFTGSVTTGAFRTIVAALQNLKELEIGLVVVDDLGTTPTTVLNHRRLEHLKLRSNIGVAIMLKGVKLSRLNQFHLWLAPLAASGCTAHDFAGSKWGTQCELTVNFTSSDVKFTEDMKRYGITVSTCNHAGWISPGIEETCQVAGIGSYTMPDKVIDNLSQ
ncbi:hypothetical protein BDN72DRAFT_906433 [Pluteus cervinus]|uniref:Uncharacterized protein n=1 Tax=Pluteus cervinus TaxID=181527 RepID=A0ACD2ZZC4_9AGAR|nr:hypothetical protein BDN72DRAFT_906433 [Pluteus cervinus]